MPSLCQLRTPFYVQLFYSLQKEIKSEAAATNMNMKGMAIVLAVILCATIAQGI